MKTFYKVLISFMIGICLIVVGISIGGMSQISSIAFFQNFHMEWGYERMNDIYFESQNQVDELKIDVHQGNVQIHQSHDIHSLKVEAKNLYSGFDVYQDNEKVVVDQPHYWWFYQPGHAQIDIYVPENMSLDKIKINMSAGRAKIDNIKADKIEVDSAAGDLSINHIECDKFDLDTSMGNTSIKYLTANKINADCGMGNVKMLLNGRESDYNYNIDVGLGNINIGGEKFSGIAKKQSHRNDGMKKLDVDCGLGNVDIEMEDL